MKLFSLGLLIIGFLVFRFPEPPSMRSAAVRFLETLTATQRSEAVLPLTSEERFKWAYVPGDRRGVSWGEMTPTQREAAVELLRQSLSAEGFSKVEAIRNLESVLAEMENGNASRDPKRYWFVFYGNPSEPSQWVWRYEGHHISLTFGNKNGRLISSTPQFLGTNPAEVKMGSLKGQRVLGPQQDLGFQMVESLSAAQQATAILSKDAPSDILTTSARKASIEGDLGLRFHQLTASQKVIFKKLLASHYSVQNIPEQKRRLAAISKEEFNDLTFVWLGPVDRRGKHYYRIQGKSFLVEYDNTQSDGNHVHTVWRDFAGDFGQDVLAEHYVHEHSK